MNYYLSSVSLSCFATFCRTARRFLPSVLRVLPLAIVSSWSSTLHAQGLAVKFYGAQTSSGGSVYDALVQAADGNFYGAAANALVRLDPEGESTNVYGFSALAADGTNVEGSQPVGGLLLGNDGNLYGLTNKGGALGLGTVFQFNPATGAVQAIASLNAAIENLGFPAAYLTPVVQDRAGNFYYLSATYTSTATGTTEVEAIIKVTPGGSVSPLHVFSTPDAEGRNPEGYSAVSGLVIDGQGNLYGFTNGGGAGALGTFYEVAPDGQATALYSYYADGTGIDYTPRVPGGRANSIVAAADGTVYGVAYNLGDAPVSGGPGVGTTNGGGIFKATGGQPEPLYVFSAGIFQADGSYLNTDGVDPTGLTLGPDGNLYGITGGGGANGTGTVFQLTPSGGFTLLYTFPPGTGAYAPPVLSTDGDLFDPVASDLGAFYRLGATLLPAFNAPTLTATVTQGVQFSLQLVAVNDPDTFTATGLPAGLSLDADTGLITGATTAAAGVYPVALTATNPDGASTATLTITVQVAPPVVEVPSTPVTSTAGQPFSYQIDATNKPTSYQIQGLPAGVTYNPNTGLVQGIFANAAKILLKIQATNADGTGSANLEIDVAPAKLPTVTVSAAANADAATGTKGAFAFSLSAATGADLSIAYTVKGSAVAGVDYKALTGSVTIPAGATSAQVKVKPKVNPDGGGTTTVKLTLEAGAGYLIGTPDPVKVKIGR